MMKTSLLFKVSKSLGNSYHTIFLLIIFAPMEKAFPFFLFIGLLSIHYVMDSSAMTPTNTTTDQLTLLSLKSQIVSDPSHLLNESWTPANFVCHWVGVTCGSRHQRVKSLNLSGMALTGRIPRDFGNLTFLVSIDLGSNNFQGILPQEMARLRRLKYLDLRFNNLSGDVPSWLGFLHQLQVLNLGNNSFTGSIPSSFSNISTLETLNLKFNSIEGQIPEVIGSLTSLRVLNLKGNKLTGFIPLSISNASRLETLEISFNSLQGNISEEIGNLHNMNTLSIQFNKLTGSIPFTIFNISRIEIIAFTNNSLSGDLPNGLCSGLSILKGLYLSENKLHGHIPTSLSNCSQLQLLGLSENEFDGPIHSEIGRLSNLHSLSLGSNHFTGIIPEEIRNLINLVELGMEKNQITGSIPISIFNISSLQLLSLARNNLIGLLPREIGNLTKMENLDFSENRFTEYGLDGLVSTKCDVFSYGIMLLETFTRRKPNEFEGDLSLKQWVSYSLPEAIVDVVDANLVTPIDNRLQKELDVVASIMKVALDCCAESPARRTNMKDVVGMLQKIKIQLLSQ